MGYEINVSLEGKHYFATADRSLGYDYMKAADLVKKFRKLFPKKDGYSVTLNKVDRISAEINIPEE